MRQEKVGPIAGPAFNGRPLRVGVPGRPGFYLYQVQFEKYDGSVLKRYEEYLRVVKPTVDTVLRTESPTYAPGEEAVFWIENRGTRSVDPVGVDFLLERFENGQWVRAPGSPMAFAMLRLKPLIAGEVGFCNSFAMPPEEPAGLYRFSKTVTVRSLGLKRRLTAEFQIAASS